MNEWEIVKRFVEGTSLETLAHYYGMDQSEIEEVIRDNVSVHNVDKEYNE